MEDCVKCRPAGWRTHNPCRGVRLHTSLEWPQSADYDSGPSHTEYSPSQAESLSPATNLCSTSMSRRHRNTATISAAETINLDLCDIANKWFRMLQSMLPIRKFVFNVRAIVWKISTRFLFYTTASCLSQIVLKFGLHWLLLPRQILPQIVRRCPCWFETFDCKLWLNG